MDFFKKCTDCTDFFPENYWSLLKMYGFLYGFLYGFFQKSFGHPEADFNTDP